MRYAPENFEKPRAAIDALLVQVVGRKDLAEGRTTKARAAVVKAPIRLRPGPPSQWEHSLRVVHLSGLSRAAADRSNRLVLLCMRKKRGQIHRAILDWLQDFKFKMRWLLYSISKSSRCFLVPVHEGSCGKLTRLNNEVKGSSSHH